MLTGLHLHPGQPVAPHDLWTAWNLDPLTLAGMSFLVWLYVRGSRRPKRGWPRRGWLVTALVALTVALVSPLEAMSGALASAHMVQHLLLILVAAPALVRCSAGEGMFAGLPTAVRKRLGSTRLALGLTPARMRLLANPVLIWLLHAGALLFWHAGGPYQAALSSTALHYLEHVTFLLTALWFWQLVLLTRHRSPDWPGIGLLMVFAMALQSVGLALLMTFAESPWYPFYENSAAAWGFTALADQHLAGVIMWVPAGFIYTAVGLTRLWRWLTAIERSSSGTIDQAAENLDVSLSHRSSAEAALNVSPRRPGVDLTELSDR